jgi:hypothetical protein
MMMLYLWRPKFARTMRCVNYMICRIRSWCFLLPEHRFQFVTSQVGASIRTVACFLIRKGLLSSNITNKASLYRTRTYLSLPEAASLLTKTNMTDLQLLPPASLTSRLYAGPTFRSRNNRFITSPLVLHSCAQT